MQKIALVWFSLMLLGGFSSLDVCLALEKKWEYQTDRDVFSSPAIGYDGTVYVGSKDGKLYAINMDGTLRWATTLSGYYTLSSPAVGVDGTIYIGSNNDFLYAVHPNGNIAWSFETNNDVQSSPALGADGTIYVGSDDSHLYAITPEGNVKWTCETGYIGYSSPAVGLDENIYVGSLDGHLYAIGPEGTIQWSYLTGDDISSSPTIGRGGTLYIGSDDGKLYAFTKGLPGLADTPWPMFRFSQQHSANTAKYAPCTYDFSPHTLRFSELGGTQKVLMDVSHFTCQWNRIRNNFG